jgi:small-conductance mechanosensitive channel
VYFLRLFLLLLPLWSLTVYAPNTAFAQKVSEATDQDQDIQKKVRNLFAEIGDFSNVFITVKGGVVTLKGRVLDLEQVARAEELASKIEGVVAVNNTIDVETSVEKRLAPALERFQERTSQFITFVPIIIVGLILFAIVAFLGFMIARMKYPWDAIAPNPFIANLLRQVVRLAFVILGIVLALDVMGATALLSTILGAAGIFGLAIGFAVRDTVENYIASVLLSFRQPFRPRDVVKIDGHEGYVIALTSRATILLTFDGNHVRIPNSTVFKGTIINYSLNPERRFSFELGVETEDLQRAVQIGLDVIKELSFVLKDPAPDGWVSEIGDSSMILWFGGWVNQNDTSLAKARAEAIRKVKLAFEAEDIGLPDPTYRLRIDEAKALPAPSRSKAKTKSTAKTKTVKATAVEEAEMDVSPDRDLEKKLEAEGKRGGGEDLLSEAAPQELS